MKLKQQIGLLLGVLIAVSIHADVIVKDDAGTDGYYSASGVTWGMSEKDAIDLLESGGYTVRNQGGGVYGIYSGGVLEGHMIVIGGQSTGGGQPAASSSIAVNKIVRRNVLKRAVPKAQPRKKKKKKELVPASENVAVTTAPETEQMRGFGTLNSGMADIFYNKWDVSGTDGATFGINPSATWGEDRELTLTVPLHIIMPDDMDNIFALGVDGAYKRPLKGEWKNFSIGAHAFVLAFSGDADSASTLGGGPYLAYSRRLNEEWIISGGVLVEFTMPAESDAITEIVPAVNIGRNVSDNVAINGYLIHYKNMDSDVEDNAYTDVGADISWVNGGWALSAGLKVATGLENIDSTEASLGSRWLF